MCGGGATLAKTIEVQEKGRVSDFSFITRNGPFSIVRRLLFRYPRCYKNGCNNNLYNVNINIAYAYY